jgi:hypothetical protein
MINQTKPISLVRFHFLKIQKIEPNNKDFIGSSIIFKQKLVQNESIIIFG